MTTRLPPKAMAKKLVRVLRTQHPDAHYLKASVLLNAKGDPRGAIAELDTYLSLQPGPDGVDQANVLRAQAEAKIAEPSTAPTTSTTLTP